jgi:hypothetical protein
MVEKGMKFSHPSQELGLAFKTEESFLGALEILRNLSAEGPIKARSLGRVGERFIALPQWMQSRVLPLLDREDVDYRPLIVRSMGELSAEERRKIKRAGIRIG